jgi:hypothetical protein
MIIEDIVMRAQGAAEALATLEGAAPPMPILCPAAAPCVAVLCIQCPCH